jgi:hypothetical protein
VLPLEQSLVGFTVGLGNVDCEVVEDEDEGLAIIDFDEVSVVLKYIITR